MAFFILGGIEIIGLALLGGLAAGAASYFLAPKPEKPNEGNKGREGNVRSAESAQHIVLGRAVKGSVTVYINGTGEDNEYLHLINVFAGHECQAIGSIYFDSQIVDEAGTISLPDPPAPAGSGLLNSVHIAIYDVLTQNIDVNQAYGAYSRLSRHLGTSSQLADVDAVAENDNWTSDHRLIGHSYIYARLQYEPEVFTSFIPSITAEVFGVKSIFDPRDNQERWTQNPALQIAWILENLLNVDRARIDQASLIEASNDCDTLVLNKAGEEEPKYTSNGYIVEDGEWEKWITPIVNTMAGAVIEWGGVYYIRAGKWRDPILTISDQDIMSAFDRQISGSDRDRANTAKGTYISPESFEEPTEFPHVVNPIYIGEDGGRVNFVELDLNFVNAHTQAQRLASIYLEESRRDEVVTIDVPLSIGLDLMPYDNVTFVSAIFGLNQTYRVIEHNVTKRDAYAVTLTLKRHDEEVYDWDPATQEGDIQNAKTNLPGVNDAVAPSVANYSITPNTTDPSEVNVASVIFNWIDPSQAFLEIEIEIHVRVDYRLNILSPPPDPWEEVTIIESRTVSVGLETSTFDILDESVPTDVQGYEFQNHQVSLVRIRSKINTNSYSNWIYPNAV